MQTYMANPDKIERKWFYLLLFINDSLFNHVHP